MTQAFRRQFFNRIDRLVVFRPLSRDVLREILHKELRDVFRRHGLRNRDWIVVWDDTAIDDDAWRTRKRAALDRQHEEGFRESPGRFAVFGLVEQMDRIEAGVRDSVRGRRTGRLDRVLAGDFDLIAASREAGEPVGRGDEG